MSEQSFIVFQKQATPVAAESQILPIKNNATISIYNESSPFFLQTKLTVGAIDDVYEKEADVMAEKVMRMPATKTEPPLSGCSFLYLFYVIQKKQACSNT